MNTNDGSADGWTDRQNFGWYNIIPSPLLVAGHKKYKVPPGELGRVGLP